MENGNQKPPLEKPGSEEAIKKAALKLFSEKGFHSTSTRDITQAAGVSKGTLYWYWKSKDEIAFSLVSDMLDHFLSLIENARDGEGPVVEKFDQLVRNAAELYYQETDYLRLLWKFRADRQYIFSEDYTEKVTTYYRRIRKAIESLIEEGIKGGVFKSVDPKRMAFTILGISEGLEVEWLENEGEFSIREALPEIMGIVISGLKKDETNP